MNEKTEDRKNIKKKIEQDYESITQKYLEGNPGVEGFIDSLVDMEDDIRMYLLETLKTKEYGEDPENTNVFEKYMKGGKDRKYLETLILNKIIGKKTSIDDLIDDGLARIRELFGTKETFDAALKKGLIQNIEIKNVILPPDPKDPPEVGSGAGFEKKELEQDKFLLFMDMLRNLKIYSDDILIIHSGILKSNMMRENTYHAIYIPRINKTVFLNVGYGEASFVCDGEVSPEIMTTYGKERLQNELGAIKIIFSEKNIQGWKEAFKSALMGEGGEVGEKIDMNEVKTNFEKKIKFNEFKEFFIKHKGDIFEDSEGKKVSLEYLFHRNKYYVKNYKLASNHFGICLPCESISFGFPKWNDLRQGLGLHVKEDIMPFEEFQKFFKIHKNDYFKDSAGNKVQLKLLFSGQNYYFDNYMLVNNQLGINLPYGYRKLGFNEIKKILGLEITSKCRKDIISFEELKNFFEKHKNEVFVDSEGNTVTFEHLFDGWSDYYENNYELANQQFGINLPRTITTASSWGLNRNQLKQKLGLKVLKSQRKREEIIGFKEFQDFFEKHKNEVFVDSAGNKVSLEYLFSAKGDYYFDNYELASQQLGVNLPSDITSIWKIKWNDMKDVLGIKKLRDSQKYIMSFEELKDFYNQHKEDIFIDSCGTAVTIKDLFDKEDYYKANYKIINKKFGINLPHNLVQTYKKRFNTIKIELGIDV